MSTHRLIGVTSAAGLVANAEAGLARVRHGDLAALLLPARKPLAAWLQTRRAEMSGLLDFQKLLERLNAQGPLLPAAYGSALLTLQDAQALLAANAGALSASFAEHGEHVQFQIEVRWNPAKAMARFRQTGLFSGLDVALAETDRKAFGAAVQALMEAERRRLALACSEILRAASRDLVLLPLADETMVLNAAALISRDGEAVLDKAVEAVDAALPDVLAIRYLGPLPAVSFACITVVEPDAARLEQARSMLGVPADAAADDIRSRYRMMIRAAHPDAAADAPLDAAAGLAQAHALALRAALAPRSAAGRPLLLDIRREGDATARQAA